VLALGDGGGAGERAALPANPADFIDVMHLGMVKPERL
jgi:hypothetical protein